MKEELDWFNTYLFKEKKPENEAFKKDRVKKYYNCIVKGEVLEEKELQGRTVRWLRYLPCKNTSPKMG